MDRTPVTAERIEQILANVELLKELIREELDVQLRFDLESVEWLDGYIERRHLEGDTAKWDGTISVIGSFLGECIRHQIGGDWYWWDDNLGIFFNEGDAVFPFNKLRKQLENGRDGGDSILDLYRTTLVIMRHRQSTQRSAPTPRAPAPAPAPKAPAPSNNWFSNFKGAGKFGG
ncbi:hypothetical protein [Andreprevotia lacus]|nr:hypothetical protein [Andreprevotia lacus]